MIAKSGLLDIPPDKIQRNPNNPRIIFREEDMQVLTESISAVGIKVPLAVYADGPVYIIIDGERRWRCARKLNLRSVPALVQPKPAPLENLLMMFNIHKVRVDWDVMPTAYKVGEVRDMLQASGQPHDVDAIAGLTGLSKSMVRTCFDLLDLPKKHRDMLMAEAEKPKAEQRITPDLFIEIGKSRRVVQRYAPEVFDQVSPSQYTDTLLRKYKRGVINSVVAFRKISKIARAERAGEQVTSVVSIIRELVNDPTYRVEDAFDDSVKSAYERRDIAARANALYERLRPLKPKDITPDIVPPLRRLGEKVAELLRN